jgi:SAM-dependent methyltransferase
VRAAARAPAGYDVVTLPSIDHLADLPDSACLALRAVCAGARYDDDLIMGLASLAVTASGSEFLPVVHHVLRRRGDAAATLARLFAYSDVVDTPTVREVLGDALMEALLHAGLLTHEDEPDHAAHGHNPERGQDPAPEQRGLRSRFHLRPLDGLWLLADDPSGGRDAVMPPAGTTRQIALVLPKASKNAVLDVGCGPGSLALTAALRGASHVVGTDINPRAIDVARFNARLNGLDYRAEFYVGDLVEPVGGAQFPLVVSQPPYVVHPPQAEAVTYLHGGPTGEELTLRLLEHLPHVLEPGGRALVLMEAVVRPHEPLHARLRPMLGDAPIDLLVLAAPGPPPPVQVLAYASLEAPGGGPGYRAAAQRYLDHLETIDASDFHHALVVLRAHPEPEGSTRRSRLAATVPVTALANGDAAALDALLEAIDLAALNDAALEQQPVHASRHAQWIEERPRPDPDREPRRSVRFGGGSFGSDCQLSADRYRMTAVLDQAPTIAAGVAEYARVARRPPATVRADLLAFVREGLMRGLLAPGAALTDP